MNEQIREYIVEGIIYRIAQEQDAPLLQELLRHGAMDSWVQIALEREPNYFDADNLMGESITVIAHKAEDSSAVIGMYSYALFRLFVMGVEESVAYLGSLRVHPNYRHKIRFLKEGFHSIEKLIPNSTTLPFCITSIASENHKARRLLESNTKGMPKYHFIAQMSTYAFATNGGILPPYSNRLFGLRRVGASHHNTQNITKSQQATKEDIPHIITFHNSLVKEYNFSPVLDTEWLENLDGSKALSIEDFYLLRDNNGDIEAMYALWDQRKIKQTVVKGYKPPLNKLRPLYNLYAKAFGHLTLPKEGTALEQIYISFFVCKSSDTSRQLQLLKEASSHIKTRGASIAIIGLDSRHPLCDTIEHKLKAKRYQTNIDAVFLGEDMWEDYQSEAERGIRAEVGLL